MNYRSIDHPGAPVPKTLKVDGWGNEALFNLFRAFFVFHERTLPEGSRRRRRTIQTFPNAFLFVELFMLCIRWCCLHPIFVVFVERFILESMCVEWWMPAREKVPHSLNEDEEKINVYLNLNI